MKNYIRVLLLFTIFLAQALPVNAQSQAIITGKIVDAETSEPIPFATVSLFTPDSSLVTGGIAELNGQFTIKVKPGTYYAIVQVVSFHSKKIPKQDFRIGTTNLGTIQLLPDVKTLQEVVVSGQRSLMQMDLDKRVFNVAEDVGNVGRTASEILDNIPSVTVDQDGAINLRGSSNVRILIDGKPSGLTGISSPDALRTLQGSMIERVEVITNPSVRYEAEGNAGIINIILKKEKERGLNGIIEANGGYPLNGGFSTNLNFRKNSVNYFVNYGLNYRERPGYAKSYQQFFLGRNTTDPDDDSTYLTRINRDFVRTGWSHNIRVGTDFNINSKNTLTAAFLYNMGDNLNTSDIFYRDFDESNNLYQLTERTDTEQEDERNYEYTLNYEKRFDHEDQKLTLYFQYRDNKEIEDSDLFQTLVFSQQDSLHRSFNEEAEENVLIQADYVHPFLKNKGRFETGYRGTIRKINTNYIVESFNEETGWENLPGFTNNFIYDETIHAMYALIGNRLGKFSYELGLRSEYTAIKTRLVNTNEVAEKNYLNFFPSIHTNYHLNNTNSFQISYSRRLRRPGFWWLNPFSSYSDPRNIRTGNPDLNPEFTDSFEAGYLANGDLFSFYGGVYYRYTTGAMERVSFPDENGVTFSMPINLSTEHAYGIETNVSRDFTKWWSGNANFNFYRAQSEGAFEGNSLNRDTYTWNMRMSNRFSFWRNASFQATFFYRAPQNTTQGERKSFYAVDVGLSKDIFAGKATLSLSGQNILNTRIYRSINSGPTFYQESEYQRSQPQFAVSFVFRINQKKMQRTRNENEERDDFDQGID